MEVVKRVMGHFAAKKSKGGKQGITSVKRPRLPLFFHSVFSTYSTRAAINLHLPLDSFK
jgi:hypothetical protein